MRLIHRVPFAPSEIEFYRQLVFQNLTYGLRCALEAADDLALALSPANAVHRPLVDDAPDIKDGEGYPEAYRAVLGEMWADPAVRGAVERGNEYALPEKCVACCSESLGVLLS
jgi:guanine nucleotide-binding protein subunit alpha